MELPIVSRPSFEAFELKPIPLAVAYLELDFMYLTNVLLIRSSFFLLSLNINLDTAGERRMY